MKSTLFILIIFILSTGSIISCNKDDEDKTYLKTETPVYKKIEVMGTGSVVSPITRYYSLESGEEIPAADSLSNKWDISFQRMEIHINSKYGAVGQYAVNANFNNIASAPIGGYMKDDESNEMDDSGLGVLSGYLFANWFTVQNEIDMTIEPSARVYFIKTTSGKYVKLQILSYYNDSNMGGWHTFEYVLQPGGSNVFVE